MISSTTRPFVLVSTIGVLSALSSASDLQNPTIGLQRVLSCTWDRAWCNIFKSRDCGWNSFVKRIFPSKIFTSSTTSPKRKASFLQWRTATCFYQTQMSSSTFANDITRQVHLARQHFTHVRHIKYIRRMFIDAPLCLIYKEWRKFHVMYSEKEESAVNTRVWSLYYHRASNALTIAHYFYSSRETFSIRDITIISHSSTCK